MHAPQRKLATGNAIPPGPDLVDACVAAQTAAVAGHWTQDSPPEWHSPARVVQDIVIRTMSSTGRAGLT
jgi:hypothetical protein